MITEALAHKRVPPAESIEPALAIIRKKEPTLLISKDIDFWLIGGVSVLAWIVSQAAVFFGNSNPAFERQITSWPYAFSVLSLICNNPHFIFSYRLAYGSSPRKIVSHWFALIFVPLFVAGLLIAAFNANSATYRAPNWLLDAAAKWPNPILDTFAHTSDLGSDILRAGVWLMWILVGWHYSKQVFGIMLKYAKFDSYPISKLQKNILRYCLLAVIPTNIIGLSIHSREYLGSIQDLSMNMMNFPTWALTFCYWMNALFVALFATVLIKNYLDLGKKPSLNFLIPFLAFYLWWMPGFWPQPYALMMVPFFHSLQYLPFSYKRLEGEIKSSSYFTLGLTFNILGIFIAGYMLFDILPAWMDQILHTRFSFGSSFFLIAAVIFFNIHHFFIDAVIWKSKQD